MLSLKIHPLFWVFILVIGGLNDPSVIGIVTWFVVVLISILGHEMGHALMSIAFGQRASIHLTFFGGVTYRQGRELSVFKEFIVVVAGPIAGFVLCLISWYLQAFVQAPGWHYALALLFTVNLVWTFLNLMPVPPLDGGQILSLICQCFWKGRGRLIAIYIGIVCSILLILTALIFRQYFIAALFAMLCFQNFEARKYARFSSKGEEKTEEIVQFEKGALLVQRGDWEEALALFVKLKKERTSEDYLFIKATVAIAHILYQSEKLEQAYAELKSLHGIPDEAISLYHRLAFHCRDYLKVQQLARKAFEKEPTAEVSLINAKAMAAVKKSEAALGWLRRAVEEGLPALKDHLMVTEFDPIREEADFKAFIARL